MDRQNLGLEGEWTDPLTDASAVQWLVKKALISECQYFNN